MRAAKGFPGYSDLMLEVRHRVSCGVCGVSWGENCVECAEDRAASHRRDTGHAVELRITREQSWDELRDQTRMARAVFSRFGGG